MLLNHRIKCFESLGSRLNNLSEDEIKNLSQGARNENAWFVEDNVKLALDGIGIFLNKQELERWISQYEPDKQDSKKIGLIAAGNIPLVGFHDILCVLLSGHRLMLKASSKDQVLPRFVLEQLFEIEPAFKAQVQFVERLNEADAFIATGSDNSSRYFEHYFKDKPNIIRKNRTSVAVLTGEENPDDFAKLGKDIFQYFGLGCRNVSKVFVPVNYDFNAFLDGLQAHQPVIEHHKYRNNYDYNKSIYLVNGEPHLDTGFLLVRESEEMVSPISVLYYQYFQNNEDLDQLLAENKSKIQCVIGLKDGFIPFGQAQKPLLWDYADGVDTLKFLCEL